MKLSKSIYIGSNLRDSQALRMFDSGKEGKAFIVRRLLGGLLIFLLNSVAISAEIHDQGEIFETHDILQLTTDTFSQTITTGVTGQLTRIQLQWNADVPQPSPQLSLSIATGGNPPNGTELFSEGIDLVSYLSGAIFSWDLREANLFFDAGEKFTLNLSSNGLGLVIAANDPPGYPGGELFLDGEVLPESWVNDIAFMTFVDPEAMRSPVEYQVTITNLTAGQTFTPQLLITHTGGYRIFRMAEPASEGLANLAEGGQTSVLVDEVGDALIDSVVTEKPLGPGETIVASIKGKPKVNFVSMAAMMIPSNDSFVGLNHLKLPVDGAVVHTLRAFDAGTEDNDQNCAHIPGAHCGGEGFSVESGEGFVHISDGIHGAGGKDGNGFEVLSEHKYDWRNPVARIKVERLK
jgi:hypothetical protein